MIDSGTATGFAERLEDAVCRLVCRCHCRLLTVIFRAITACLPFGIPSSGRQCLHPTMGALHQMLSAATRRPDKGKALISPHGIPSSVSLPLPDEQTIFKTVYITPASILYLFPNDRESATFPRQGEGSETAHFKFPSRMK